MFPSRNIVGFGDTHPGKIRTDFFSRMISNAQQFGKKDQWRQFTALLSDNTGSSSEKQNVKAEIISCFADKPLKLYPTVPAGKIEDFVSPTFWAPRVSWFVQRKGMYPDHSSNGITKHFQIFGLKVYHIPPI